MRNPFKAPPPPTELQTVQTELSNAKADLLSQQAKLEYSTAMVGMLQQRIDRLQAHLQAIPQPLSTFDQSERLKP